jgi:hypothetical protein
LLIHKTLVCRKSFTSAQTKRTPRTKLKSLSENPILIIGFDAEWVSEPPEPPDEEGNAFDDSADGDDCEPLPPDQVPHNRILSYQYACRYGDREWSGVTYTSAGARLRHPEKSDEEIAELPERIRFGELLATAIALGIRGKYLTRWPEHVIAAAHWTRADLSAMADFATIKRQFDAVQNTYLTLDEPYTERANVKGHVREFRVSLVDTQLLSPGSSKSLTTLGDLYAFPKLDPGQKQVARADGTIENVPYIEHMDWLLVEDPARYEAYAIRDAEISARHVDEVLKFVNGELQLNCRFPPATLGSLAVRHLLESWNRQGVNADAVLDRQIKPAKRYDPNRGRYYTKWKRDHSPRFKLNQQLAVECFHGGRNECFSFGPTRDAACASPFREYDLISAYAVALASIRMPDWPAMYDCRDPTEYRAGVLGCAYLRFRFPDSTRFPSLPVVAPNDYGLVYTLQGESYVTASEIAVACRQGAAIDIIDGVIIPWRDDGSQPFMIVTHDLLRRRQQYPRGTLPNEMFKQLGNSLYGKLGQGIKENTAYNTRTDGREKIGASEISNPYLAGHVSGLIRALISELLASTPPHRTVNSVTTDAFITNAEIGEIDASGPVATFLSRVKQQITSDPTLLEMKFEARQLLPWRTRGVATLRKHGDSKPKLARGGMREPGRMSLDDANDWFVRSMLLRQQGDKWAILEPQPFPAAHRANADHAFQIHERRVNFEFDFKRVPLNPILNFLTVPAEPGKSLTVIVQHTSFETTPWRTVTEFVKTREMFDAWRLKRGGQMKTMADWRRWVEYRDSADACRAGVHRSAKGLVDQARRLVIRAYRGRQWGLAGGSYKDAATLLTTAGYPTTEQDFKNAARARGALPEHVIPAGADGVQDLVRAVVAIWPGFEWWRLVGQADADYLREIPKSRRRNGA